MTQPTTDAKLATIARTLRLASVALAAAAQMLEQVRDGLADMPASPPTDRS